MIGMPGGSFGSEMVLWTTPARAPSRRHAAQLGVLGAAGGRGWPRRFYREHLDGAGDAFLGGGSALSVRAVAALEQSLDEHELLPAAELHGVVAHQREREHGGVAYWHDRAVARYAGVEAVAVGGEADRAQRLGALAPAGGGVGSGAAR